MPIKNATLGLCLLVSGSALADVEYRVQTGDTLATISAHFHVSGKKILHANDLPAGHHMRPGHFLLIPGVANKSDKRSAAKVSSKSRVYTVRNGDFDWAIAKRNHLSERQLHLMNPSVDWDALQVGTKLSLPGAAPSPSTTVVASARHSTAHHAGPTHFHVVETGENDWIIAHRGGIRLSALKAVNPGLDLSLLHPGQKIRVPGSAGDVALRVPKIHSTHVAIKGDNVTIRRDAGRGSDSICTVDSGLRAAVIDRDGNWYQLRFPKGTVGWVRGDFLKPIHEAVAEVSHHRRREYIVERPRHHSTMVFNHHHATTSHSHSAARMAVTHDSGSFSSPPDPETAVALLHKAHTFIGERYRWGEASRSGTDCSGFTTQVFRAQGIHLPRTSHEQAGSGQRVPFSEMRPGDLVLFHTRGSRINHVGIYEGGGRFIHASSGKGHVREDSIMEGFYRNRFSTARRVLHPAHKPKPKQEEKHEDKPKAAAPAAVASASVDTKDVKAPDPQPAVQK